MSPKWCCRGQFFKHPNPIFFLKRQNNTLQRTNIENWMQIFSEKDLRGHSPHFHIHVSVRAIYIFLRSNCPFLHVMQEICGQIKGIYKSLTDTWMLKLGRSIPRKGRHKWDFRCSIWCIRVFLRLLFLIFRCVHAAQIYATPPLLFWSAFGHLWGSSWPYRWSYDLYDPSILPLTDVCLWSDISACLMTFLILPSSLLNELSVMTFWFVFWPFGSCWGQRSKPLGLC